MKPKVAFFDFAGCEGDQLQVANLEEDLLALLRYYRFHLITFRKYDDVIVARFRKMEE